MNNTSLTSPRRRKLAFFLLAAGLAPVVLRGDANRVPAGRLTLPPPFRATFLQPWKQHLELGAADWAQRLDSMRALGCQDLILQWAGVDNNSDPWILPDATLSRLLELSRERNMGLQIGLPYDEGWWQALQGEAAGLRGFLDRTADAARAWLQDKPWPGHPAFRGWYIPYEIEQYSWLAPERRTLLIAWLEKMAGACLGSHPGQSPAISTYLSALSPPAGLAVLWSNLLDRLRLRPMVQDGAGVHGMENLAGLEPLRRLLLERGVAFDLVLELFEQTSAPDAPFKARAAPYARVHRQLDVARGYGAETLIAFAVDPWMIGDEAGARALLRSWKAIY